MLYIDMILVVKIVFEFKQFFYSDIKQIKPDIRQIKPDIRPNTGYKEGRISGTYNPNLRHPKKHVHSELSIYLHG